MASSKSSIALWLVLVSLMVMCPASPMAAVYKVGDGYGSGWNRFTNLFQWSYTKRFYVGDTVLFSYDNREDNILQVNLVDYYLCNTSSPMATYNSGSESITFKRPGDYNYISGYNLHCYDGVKVAFIVELPFHVNTSDSSPAPAPTPTSSPISNISPSVKNHDHAANSSSKRIQLLDDIFLFGIMIFGIVTFLF